MGRLGVTLDDVKKAVQQLQADGITATIDNIRKTIGSGSKTTITRHLHELKKLAEQDDSPSGGNTMVAGGGSLSAEKNQAFEELQKNHDILTRQLQVRNRICSQLEEKMVAQEKLMTVCKNELGQKNTHNIQLTQRLRVLAGDLQKAKIAIQHLQQQVVSLENTKRALMVEKQRFEEQLRILHKQKVT